MLLSPKWCKYFTMVDSFLENLNINYYYYYYKVHFYNTHKLLLLSYNVSKLYRARQASRENKDLANRTFQELHVNEVWHTPKRNSDYWLGSRCCTSQKLLLNPYLEYSAICHASKARFSNWWCFLRHILWNWLVNTLTRFLLVLSDFIWSFQIKIIAHCLY